MRLAVWFGCLAVAVCLQAKACEANSVAGDRLLNGQAGKKDEVLSKEAGDRVSETLFSVCDGWYRSSV
jgi:hypothetical protein